MARVRLDSQLSALEESQLVLSHHSVDAAIAWVDAAAQLSIEKTSRCT
jgi:hypothetical protein